MLAIFGPPLSKRSKLTEAQIGFRLKQAGDDASTAKVCWMARILKAMFYNYCRKYAGLISSEEKRLKKLGEVTPG